MLSQDSAYSKYLCDINDFKVCDTKGKSPYLVENTTTKKNYVAKVIPIDTIEKKNRIISEIIKIVRVKRPTIANFNGYSLTDFEGRNNVTIFTEFVRNGSLADIFYKNKKDVLNYNFNNIDRQIILIGIAHEMKWRC